MKRSGMVLAVLGLGLGLGRAAAAQDERRERRGEESGVVGRAERFFEERSLTVQGGGGLTNLTEGGAKDVTDAGGTWTLRGVWGMARPYGAEVAYVGASVPLEQPAASNAVIIQTGFEALFRAALPFHDRNSFAAPYLGAGLGWGHYNTVGATEGTANVSDSDNVIAVPLAAGIAVGYEQFSLDTRVMYRAAFGDDLLGSGSTAAGSRGLNAMMMTATLGYTF